MTSTQLSRSLKTQSELHEFYGKPPPTPKPLKQKIVEKCTISAFSSHILSLFPIIKVIRTYKIKEYILDDVISGLTAACLHFPQGLAFGLLSSLTPAYGLYTSFFPVLLYVIFGTSQHVSFGTNAVIAIFTSELVNLQLEKFPHASSDAQNTVNVSDINITTVAPGAGFDEIRFKSSVAAGSAFVVGILLFIMGIFRMGFITSYLSSSFIAAFTTTGAIHIISSQIPSTLGIKIPPINRPGKLIYVYIEIFKAIPKIHIATFIVSIICAIILVFFKDFINQKYSHKMKMPIPIDIILVVLATVISHFAELHDNFGIGIIGEIPTGLPVPKLPRINVDVIGHSIVVGFIIFVLTISMARICELKHNYSVDDNQELVAYGMANLGSSFFSCFPACVAPPRTIILSAMGARTTLNGLFSAVVVLLMILFIGKYLEAAPHAVLAVMIIVAIKNLLGQFQELPKLWRVNRYDFVIFVGTFLSGVLIDFPYALYVGVLLCMFTVVVQSQMSSAYTIGKVEHEDRLLSTKLHDLPCINPKIAVFRMESSLYFATVDKFQRALYQLTLNPKEFRQTANVRVNNVVEVTLDVNDSDEQTDDKRSLSNMNIDLPPPPLSYIIIDCSSVNYIDMNGINTLMRVYSDFKKIGVTVVFGNCTDFMRNTFEKSTLSKEIESQHIYADILDAYLAITQGNLGT